MLRVKLQELPVSLGEFHARDMKWLNGKVSDGSQPPMALDLSASETAGSRSLDRLVRISFAWISNLPI
jgi:hypothetical protein